MGLRPQVRPAMPACTLVAAHTGLSGRRWQLAPGQAFLEFGGEVYKDGSWPDVTELAGWLRGVEGRATAVVELTPNSLGDGLLEGLRGAERALVVAVGGPAEVGAGGSRREGLQRAALEFSDRYSLPLCFSFRLLTPQIPCLVTRHVHTSCTRGLAARRVQPRGEWRCTLRAFKCS